MEFVLPYTEDNILGFPATWHCWCEKNEGDRNHHRVKRGEIYAPFSTFAKKYVLRKLSAFVTRDENMKTFARLLEHKQHSILTQKLRS